MKILIANSRTFGRHSSEKQTKVYSTKSPYTLAKWSKVVHFDFALIIKNPIKHNNRKLIKTNN